jgi:hypothetical protein
MKAANQDRRWEHVAAPGSVAELMLSRWRFDESWNMSNSETAE